MEAFPTWFIPADEEEKCEKCKIPMRARVITRGDRKFCSQKCAKEATGLDYDPAINNFLINIKKGKLIPG